MALQARPRHGAPPEDARGSRLPAGGAPGPGQLVPWLCMDHRLLLYLLLPLWWVCVSVEPPCPVSHACTYEYPLLPTRVDCWY
jgi:hypothetical protein